MTDSLIERADAVLRPSIDLRAGDLPRIIDEAIAALRAAGSPIYDRGGALYRPTRIETHDTTDGVRRAPGTIVLRPVDPTWLRVRLATVAQWRRWRERERDWRAADPPAEIARSITEMPDAAAWPYLRAVVAHPIITPEGRIITAPGYDPDTRLLIDIERSWSVPESPTREDAVAACGRLGELLRHYPWVSSVDRAVALSLLLTAIARPVLPTAPLHGIDAPEPGSGKSLLVDVAAILATGAPAAVMDYGDDPGEAGKRLDGMLLAGDSMIAIDNIERPLEGAAICQTLTQPTRRIRPLGASVVVTVPCTAMFAATGCNLTLRGDIVRRAIVCRLDARTERPELRAIDQDLLAETYERRRELVADTITIMRSYALAGHPDARSIGSYAGWSRMVRSALVWAGEADPVEAMERTRGADPSRQSIHAVLRAWYRIYGSDPVTAADVIARTAADDDLRDALAMVCTRRGQLDSLALGRWLRSHRDRRAGTLVLRRHTARTAVARWIVTADTVGDDVGIGGDNRDDLPLLRESGSQSIDSGVTDQGEWAGGSQLSPPSLPAHDGAPSTPADAAREYTRAKGGE